VDNGASVGPGTLARLVEVARLAGVARLVPSVTHQLSTPLASIALRAESLERAVADLPDSALSQKVKTHLQAIRDDTFRCKELLGTLQDFARPPVATVAAADLNAVGRGAVLLVHHEALRRQIQIDARLQDGLPTVRGDEGRLAQAVLALLQNAVLASPSGGRILLETSADAELVTVSVADEGDGIPDEIRRRLVEPFVSTRPAEAGGGLGLMACHQIAAAHGGTLKWESVPGRGSRFSIVLPRGGPPPPSEPPG
jgi:two-component system NtrC family sensor kinase